MKFQIFKLSLFCFIFVLIGASCQDDDDLFEIQIGDENAVIQQEVDGIEFKFCLLNEDGEPTTVFEQGENFSFLFEIANHREAPLEFFDYDFYLNDDFFSVKSKGKNFGRPFLYVKDRGTYEIRYLSPGITHVFETSWKETRYQFEAMYGIFSGNNKEALTAGDYYTQFSHNFQFGDLSTGELTFKINFEIK